MKHTKAHTQNPFRTAPYKPISEYTRYRNGKRPAHQILDTAPRRVCHSAESEETLFLLFSELDALILDNMPDSLCIEPVNLIRIEYQQQTGISLSCQEILNAYNRFTQEDKHDNP